MKNVEVSVCCITYNHQPFIKKAIDSFLSQETNFDFEIIIHDDCSTDGTIDVLKEYEQMYPDIIKIIFETENQWQKTKKGIFVNYTLPHSQGKYIAICEGDDYWIDPRKLQKQYDVMENNKQVSLCFHDAVVTNCNGEVISTSMMKGNPFYKNSDGLYSCDEMLVLDFVPTASLFFRKEMLIDNLLPYFDNGYCEDLPLRITLVSKGAAYCINEKMSAYRTGNPLSVNGTIRRKPEKIKATLMKHIEILREFDEETKFKFHEAVEYAINDKLVHICITTGDLKKLRSKELAKQYKTLSFKRKLACFLAFISPSLFYALCDIKAIFKSSSK